MAWDEGLRGEVLGLFNGGVRTSWPKMGDGLAVRRRTIEVGSRHGTMHVIGYSKETHKYRVRCDDCRAERFRAAGEIANECISCARLRSGITSQRGPRKVG